MKNCLDEQVLPRSLLPVRLTKLSNHPFDDFSHLVLVKHIEVTKANERAAFRKLQHSKHNFMANVPAACKESLLDVICSGLRRNLQKLRGILNRKLNNLISNSNWTKNSNPNCVVNLSTKEINNSTLSALGYGISFSLSRKPKASDIASSLAKLEKCEEIPPRNLDIVRGLVYGAANTPQRENYPLRFRKSIQDLKKDDALHITRADKSNTLVIMDKCNYIEKMEGILSDRTTYTLLRKNPLDDIIKTFNNALDKVLKNNSVLAKQFKCRGPSLPYMYGVVKTHKQNNPLRPIISSVGTITYKLSRYLAKLLSPLLGTVSQSHIVHSEDLIKKLNSNPNVSNIKLISFDVVSLFTKVPVPDILSYLSTELENHNFTLSSSTIIQLVAICVNDCRFTFNNKYYKQTFGMPMGNSLSPLLVNLYMEFFEKHYVYSIPNIVLKWYRYVDDVICLWPREDSVDNFLNSINNCVPSIKFTTEIEQNNQLPFLDLIIHRQPNCFKYSVYRKPTNNLSYIHYYSGHSMHIKKAVFISMYLRAYRVVSPEYLGNEITFINNIGKKLCYPNFILDICHTKARKRFYDHVPFRSIERMPVLSLQYFPPFEGIVGMLKLLNIRVVFKYTDTIQKLLIKNSPCSNSGCIYKIPCKTCNSYYIGETSKEVTDRVKNHKRSIQYAQTSNAIFLHVRDFSHPIDFNTAQCILRCPDTTTRNIIESALIQLTYDTNMNNSEGLFTFDNILLKLFYKQFRNRISEF